MTIDLKAILVAAPLSTSHQFCVEKQRYPSAVAEIDQIDDYLTKKLYCELTTAIKKYLSNTATNGPEGAEFLYTVIYPLKQKLSILKICKLVSLVCSRLEPDDALLLLGVFEPICVNLPEPTDLSNINKAAIYIRANRLKEAAELLFQVIPKSFDSRVGIKIGTHAEYHKISSKYYQATNNPKELFDNLNLFIAYTQLNSLTRDEQIDIAFKMVTCGLVADDMFDFGELRMAPILTVLEDTVDKKWILELLDIAVDGDFKKYEDFANTHQDILQETFGSFLKSLNLKMKLTALLELAFQQPKNCRHLNFQQISECCRIPINEVERFFMKIMSLELIKGSIDEISENVELTWVKPRMIDLSRVAILKNRFQSWADNVQSLISELETATTELLAT